MTDTCHHCFAPVDKCRCEEGPTLSGRVPTAPGSTRSAPSKPAAFRPAGDDPSRVNGKLTAKYSAMSPLQKWETLVLNGLIGTDEPWIEDMRQALLRQEGGWTIERSLGQQQIDRLSDENEQLRRDLDKAMPDATRCEACLAPLFEDDGGIVTDDNGCTTCRPAMPPAGAEDPALDVVIPGPCFAYRSLDRTVADAVCDSGSRPSGENSRSEVEGEARQSGGAAASPERHRP